MDLNFTKKEYQEIINNFISEEALRFRRKSKKKANYDLLRGVIKLKKLKKNKLNLKSFNNSEMTIIKFDSIINSIYFRVDELISQIFHSYKNKNHLIMAGASRMLYETIAHYHFILIYKLILALDDDNPKKISKLHDNLIKVNKIDQKNFI